MSNINWLRRSWRTLLELDRDATVRTDEDVAAEVKKNYNWNFFFAVAEGAVFWFGNTFIGGVTIAPLFVSRLTDNTFLIGLVSVVSLAGWYLPQLLTASWAEGLVRKKAVVVNLGFFSERLPLFVLAGSALVAMSNPALALGLFFWAFIWRELGAGLVATSWQDMLARLFPVKRRGFMLGLTFVLGAGTGVLAAQIAGWLLATLPFPTNFAATFGLGALFVMASWFLLALVREPIAALPPRAADHEGLWAGVGRIWRADANFRRFLVSRVVLTLGTMGTGFVTVIAVGRFDLPDQIAGTYSALLLVGQVVGNVMVSVLADRTGHKLTLALAAVFGMAAFGLAWFAPSAVWYYPVFVLVGMMIGVSIVSGVLISMEFGPATRRPTYIGMVNTVVGLGSAAAPLIGAAVLDGLGSDWLYGASAVCNLLALALLGWWVREPRKVAVISVEGASPEGLG